MSQNRSLSDDYQHQLSCFPYGVGRQGEGICLLMRMGPYRILLDCGLRDIQPLQIEHTPPADLVFCSHAHNDHARGLLSLHQAFPQLPIYGSEVTVELLPLSWLTSSCAEIPAFCQGLKWRTPIHLFKDLTAEIFPAGHLPGAAAILFTYQTPKRSYKVFYTGDFSLSNFQLVEGLSVELLRGLAPDVLIIEGTYGTIRHPHRRQQEKQLMERIYEGYQNHQNILLPVPTLGLGQEILKLLRSHHQFTGKDLDIWVDGNVIKACDIYLKLLSEFPSSVQNFAKHQPLFWDERISPKMHRLAPENITPLRPDKSIVVTDKLSELAKYCQANTGNWLILMPDIFREYLEQSPLKELKRSPLIKVDTYLLAEHSDSRNTTQLIHNLKPQHIIVVHGSPTYLGDLTSLEELQNRYQLHSPAVGIQVELPIGDRFIQPAAPTPTYYEGELNEQETCVTITLPDLIVQDPRWSAFADTGLVEARWQGEELLLRGLSQRELLSQNNVAKGLDDVDCCRTCGYFRGQKCWNTVSPLYGFKVTPDGYCPVFEASEPS